MKALIWTANILGWPVIHLAVGKIVLRLPVDQFRDDSFLFAARGWERSGEFYRRRFAIRSWKGLLPDGAPWLGGMSKRRLTARNRSYVDRFILETRRAEFAHWCMLLCLPIFFTWNPPWACWVMTFYAVAANIPCIAVQRYNRLMLARLQEQGSAMRAGGGNASA